ncbi:hypothetical protein BHU25_13825 [Pseudomonas vranovensis]|uniref:Uncharacterized protein n=1 Tax=Pseudomonas vranovensis TaxID=321661 RepID=A0A423DMB4_9PSED|nr:hypothetical protein BHU25_13825 [Pseudomonas vranovensis]
MPLLCQFLIIARCQPDTTDIVGLFRMKFSHGQAQAIYSPDVYQARQVLFRGLGGRRWWMLGTPPR